MIDENEFRAVFAEILGLSPADISPDTVLTSLESYDSTAQLSLMVCLADFSTREIGLAEIRSIVTYGDVLKLLAQ